MNKKPKKPSPNFGKNNQNTMNDDNKLQVGIKVSAEDKTITAGVQGNQYAVNFSSNMSKGRSGFRRRLPEKPIHAILPL